MLLSAFAGPQEAARALDLLASANIERTPLLKPGTDDHPAVRSPQQVNSVVLLAELVHGFEWAWPRLEGNKDEYPQVSAPCPVLPETRKAVPSRRRFARLSHWDRAQISSPCPRWFDQSLPETREPKLA
jgi:hypothetical protein